MQDRGQEPLDEEQISKNKRQRTIQGLCFIALLAIIIAIGFIDGDLFGKEPEQRILTHIICVCVLIGAFRLFLRKR